jgi:hypothetical protein
VTIARERERNPTVPKSRKRKLKGPLRPHQKGVRAYARNRIRQLNEEIALLDCKIEGAKGPAVMELIPDA